MKPREAGSNQEIGNPNTRPLLRRRLLKSMATGGGALVLGIMLPGKWIKPVINIGVLPAHAQTSSGSQQFAATGSSQTFLVPAGVFSVYVELAGGQGGADGSGGQGGQGGTTTGTLSVTPGESLTVLVGQQGSISPGGSRVTGGQSGGGYSGGASSPGPVLSGSGGGGTFILRGSTRLLVAGGGGGAGGQGATGGNGGGASGQDGQGLSGNTSYGRGGTPTTGGAAGGRMPQPALMAQVETRLQPMAAAAAAGIGAVAVPAVLMAAVVVVLGM